MDRKGFEPFDRSDFDVGHVKAGRRRASLKQLFQAKHVGGRVDDVLAIVAHPAQEHRP